MHNPSSMGYTIPDTVPDFFKNKLIVTIEGLLKKKLNKELTFSSIYLFGSLARGDHITCNSDIDILLTYHELYSLEERSIVYEFIDADHPAVDIVLRTYDTMENNSTFSKLVRKDWKLLWREKQ